MEVHDIALHPGVVRVARVVDVARVARHPACEELLDRVRGKGRVRVRFRVGVRVGVRVGGRVGVRVRVKVRVGFRVAAAAH